MQGRDMSWEYCSEGWCAAREESVLGGQVLLERHNRSRGRYDHMCILPGLTESEFNRAKCSHAEFEIVEVEVREVEPYPIAVTKSRFKEVTQKMTTIHTADDGWQFAEVEFKSTISESEFCICDACHKTSEVMKLTLPETAYHRNGQLSTKYREYWLCPPCRRKLVHALDWPEE